MTGQTGAFATPDDPMAGPVPDFESSTTQRIVDLERMTIRQASRLTAMSDVVERIEKLEDGQKASASAPERKSELWLTSASMLTGMACLVGNYILHYKGIPPMVDNAVAMGLVGAPTMVYSMGRSSVKKATQQALPGGTK